MIRAFGEDSTLLFCLYPELPAKCKSRIINCPPQPRRLQSYAPAVGMKRVPSIEQLHACLIMYPQGHFILARLMGCLIQFISELTAWKRSGLLTRKRFYPKKYMVGEILNTNDSIICLTPTLYLLRFPLGPTEINGTAA